MFDPFTALAALAPVAVEAGRALVQRYIVPDNIKPASVADVVALGQLDNEKFRILQDADKGGESYRWVEAVRKLQRPIVVFVLLGSYVLHPDNEGLAQLFGVAMFYLFGERTLSAALSVVRKK